MYGYRLSIVAAADQALYTKPFRNFRADVPGRKALLPFSPGVSSPCFARRKLADTTVCMSKHRSALSKDTPTAYGCSHAVMHIACDGQPLRAGSYAPLKSILEQPVT